MSIDGAVNELNEEISRLTGIRDSLLNGTPPAIRQLDISSAAAPPKRKYTRTAKKASKTVVPSKKPATKKSRPSKAVSVKAVASAKSLAPVKKRTVSAETRKKMSDAAKARTAKKALAVK
jgi:hypothetical protein